jgi:uncharacterized protein YceK
MRPRALPLLAAVLAVLPSGCGTFVNLTAPPGPPVGILSNCAPFGGAVRSGMLGMICLGGGLEGQGEFGQGRILVSTGLMAAGVALLAVDAPLSLLGDVLTLPVASARYNAEPWASWWGEPSRIHHLLEANSAGPDSASVPQPQEPSQAKTAAPP